MRSERSDIRWLAPGEESTVAAEKSGPRDIIVIGDGAVGKTSLIRRFVHDEFDDKYLTTIGNKISETKVEIPLEGGGTTDLGLKLWDVSDQRGDRSTQSFAFERADGGILVCDLLRKDTLRGLEKYWLPNLKAVAGDLPLVFVANKSDLLYGTDYSMEELEMIILSADEIEDVVAKYDAPVFRTSALNGENVEEAFFAAAKLALEG